eukprot:gene12848-15089_t
MDKLNINQLFMPHYTSHWKNLYITGFVLSFVFGVRILSSVFRKRFVIAGKLAVVTGASSGIGLSIATELAKAGATVCLVARSKDRLEELVNGLKGMGLDAFYVCADLSKPADVTRWFEQFVEIVGDRPVDILVNCAGAGKWKFIEETSMEECQDMMSLPYFASFYMTRMLAPKMLAEDNGYIINVNSPVSYQPWPGCIGYACSRYAMKGFTEALRMEFRGTNVRVMEVIAGETLSNYFEANGIDQSHFPFASALVPKISPDSVGKSTVVAIANNQNKCVVPFTLSLVLGVGELFPGFLSALMCRTGRGDARIAALRKAKKE